MPVEFLSISDTCNFNISRPNATCIFFAEPLKNTCVFLLNNTLNNSVTIVIKRTTKDATNNSPNKLSVKLNSCFAVYIFVPFASRAFRGRCQCGISLYCVASSS